ncbi:hypothetical protein [Yoonia sp. SDW83-1]|uniref:hypothetical protein n=1 Tax=Yoonia sp. SDW83-1 TaxID=3366945 RepID=UPI00398C6C5D
MSELIYRQRRRFILIALLTCLPMTGMVIYSAYLSMQFVSFSYFLSEPVMLLWMYLFYALMISVMNAAILFFPALLIVFAPRWRGIIEGATFGIGLALLIAWIVDLIDHNSLLAQSRWLLTWVIFLAAMYFRVHDRILPKLRYKARVSYRSRKPITQLWSELVPIPEHTDQHWNVALVDITADPDDPTKLHAVYDLPKCQLHQTMQIRQSNAPVHFAYRYENASIKNAHATAGNYAISIEDLDFTRKVTLELITDKLPFSQWMGHWFGDVLGDQADYLVTQETGKRDYTTTGAIMRKAAGRQTGSISPSARAA